MPRLASCRRGIERWPILAHLIRKVSQIVVFWGHPAEERIHLAANLPNTEEFYQQVFKIGYVCVVEGISHQKLIDPVQEEDELQRC